jgi:hypothetical protein
MQPWVKWVLGIGIVMIIISISWLILIIGTKGVYNLTPMDVASLGLACIGFAIGWPSFQRSD